MRLPEAARALCWQDSDQAQFPRPGYSLRAALDPEFFKYPAVVPFDCVQGEKKASADLLIGQPAGDKAEDLQFPLAQGLAQRLTMFGGMDGGFIPVRP